MKLPFPSAARTSACRLCCEPQREEGEALVVASQGRDLWRVGQSSLDIITGLSAIGGPQLNSPLTSNHLRDN